MITNTFSESPDSPVSLSTGGAPLQKISKVVDPRDTRVLFGILYSLRDKASEKRALWKSWLRKGGLEGWSGAVVLVEYLALVDAHDPVEADYEE